MQQVIIKLLQNGVPLKRYKFYVEYENGREDCFQTDEDGKSDISIHKVGTKLKIRVNDKDFSSDLFVKEGINEYVYNIDIQF